MTTQVARELSQTFTPLLLAGVTLPTFACMGDGPHLALENLLTPLALVSIATWST